MKFIGSYPRGGEAGEEVRVESGNRWQEADRWLASLRDAIT